MSNVTTFTRRDAGNLSTERLDRLIRVEELAKRLHVKKNTVYSWCFHREIPYYSLGRLSLFDPVEVLEWLDRKRVEPVGGRR